MKLKEYLNEVGIPIEKFARRVGVCATTIQNVIQEKRDLRVSIAIKIEDATLGDNGKPKVTIREMVPKHLQRINPKKDTKNKRSKHENKEENTD
jgi:DNA-binding transcriptional regulator YdaS (Cro superfamily)